ncbi:hypothetical protein QBL02_05325 [Leucobacter sp. UT-8R-CII-1-4]|uniref:hypothetical protein n=1 Tax=Leucobacter sp. UT-8R-CII-1-4 TaxID=3040075 RepID=UPI0024A9A2B5|nr:hypothetical protein [Leucobacter sp. UT-8R-CII-1-4]MDI6022962.1 hypothetical protein [Leucobacter sp. UT-8R-CII-1-4]
MRRLSPALGNVATIALIALPIALAAVLNQTLRPYLAERLGGTPHASGGWSRGSYLASNRWWEFDAATQLKHPLLTTYLEQWDGLYLAAGGILSVIIASIVFYLAARTKTKRSE